LFFCYFSFPSASLHATGFITRYTLRKSINIVRTVNTSYIRVVLPPTSLLGVPSGMLPSLPDTNWL